MKIFIDSASGLEVTSYSVYLADYLAAGAEADSQCDPETEEQLRWLLLHAGVQASSGHMRTDLETLAGDMAAWYRDIDGNAPEHPGAEFPGLLESRLDYLLKAAADCGLVSRLPGDGSPADSLPVPRPPLVLSADGRFLYFLRRRREEDEFLKRLESHCRPGRGEVFPSFPDLPPEPEGMLAGLLSRGRRFLILNGGPGTGKTTTVARLLSLLSSGAETAGIAPPRVILAAPTGRAAARLGEALGDEAESPTGRTLHSLLGLSPRRPPRHDEDNPLAADLVIVDEASMVDLPMMNRLLAALAPETALLLVGDPDQLPSVEAGALLGDLLGGYAAAAEGAAVSPLGDGVVTLTKVYRSATAILDAAAAVRDGDAGRFLDACSDDGVRIRDLSDPEHIASRLAGDFRGAVESAASASAPDSALFDTFTEHGVLTPLRRGPWGVTALNDRISGLLGRTTGPFPGMPIMVTGNDRTRRLWNGDRGVLLENEGRLRAFFPDGEGYRMFPLAALPGWEPAWVQTIHKSQGSEFDRVTVLLPRGAERLLTREILYTALTRARHLVDLHIEEGALEASLERRVFRNSRIRDWAAG